jgi:two-component system phosphate regulon sensor histidine kinase PhoR
MNFRLPFKGWILLGCVIVVLCTQIITGLILERFLRKQMVADLNSSLYQQIVILREVISERWQPDDPVSSVDALADDLGRRFDLRLTLIEPGGRVLGDSEVPIEEIGRLDNHANRPEVVQAFKNGRGWSIRRSATLGLDLLYVAGLFGRPEQPVLVIRLALPLGEVEIALSRMRRLITWAVLLGVLLSVCVAFIVAHHLFRPIKDLTQAALDISAGKPARHLRWYPNHEIGDLGRAFDRMADDLQEEIKEVTRARDRLEAILRGMVEGVLVTDETGRITLVNQALKELLDLTIDPADRMPSEVIRNPDLIEVINRVIQTQSPASLEIRTLEPPRRTLAVELAALPGHMATAGIVAVFHDITERKRIEDMRREFVANVSHELRTPLTAIKGAVETLLDGALENPEVSRNFTEVIHRHVKRLEALVLDLLDLSRLESGTSRSLDHEVELVALARNVLTAVADLAAARNLSLESEIPEESLVVRGDSHQLEQALFNLLDNAIKYTEPGGRVTLDVRRDNDIVRVDVSDTGLGIDPEHLPRIFERFYRADKIRSRDLGGTGLGLAIVKHVAQSHKGRVEVDSQPGRGSRFSLILPCSPTSQPVKNTD